MTPFVVPLVDMREVTEYSVIPQAVPIPSGSGNGSVTYDPRHAATAAVISGLAYKANGSRLNRHATHLGTLETFDSKNQRALVIGNEKDIWVAFEGSDLSTRDDYLINLHHTRTPHPIGGLVHQGFSDRLYETVRDSSVEAPAEPLIRAVHRHIVKMHHYFPQARIHFTGHSSGGASAVLQAAYLAHKSPALAEQTVGSITTFGQPRVGNRAFYEAFQRSYRDTYHRFALPHDLVTTLPPSYSLGEVSIYQHGGVLHSLAQPLQQSISVSQAISEADAEEEIAMQGPSRPRQRGVGQQIIHFLRQHHGIGAYLDACLAPTGLRGPQFVKQFFAGYLLPIGDADIRPPFDGMPVDYLLHSIDMLEHYRPAITSPVDGAHYDRSLQALRLIRGGWQENTEHSVKQFGISASRLIPLVRIYANEQNGLGDLGELLRWIEHEALRPTPQLMQLQDFVRQLGDLDMRGFPVAERESLRGYELRLQEMLGEHIVRGTLPNGHTAERIGYLMRHISRVLEPHLNASSAGDASGCADVSQQADRFRKIYAEMGAAVSAGRG